MSRLARLGARHDDEVHLNRKLRPPAPVTLANPALDAVADDRTPDLAADRDAHATAAREREHHQMCPAHTAPAVLDCQVVCTAAHERRPRKALASPLGGTSGASVDQDAYFLATVTVS